MDMAAGPSFGLVAANKMLQAVIVQDVPTVIVVVPGKNGDLAQVDEVAKDLEESRMRRMSRSASSHSASTARKRAAGQPSVSARAAISA